MSQFNVLPGFQKSPAGWERVLLRRLPRALWLGTALLAACAGLARLLPWSGTASEVSTRLATIDIWLISLVVLHWTVVLTLAIGAVIVLVMKGPASPTPIPCPMPTGLRRPLPGRTTSPEGPRNGRTACQRRGFMRETIPGGAPCGALHTASGWIP